MAGLREQRRLLPMSPSQPRISLIVAMDRKRGIGIGNQLPWKLPEDLAHFKRTTTGHAIIMGRKTFDSIGRPLPGRRNIVVTRNPAWQVEGVLTASTPAQACAFAQHEQRAFIIGGAELFVQTITLADRMIVTEIDAEFECDTFFPEIDRASWHESGREPVHSAATGLDFAIVTYDRVR
jgi:dihydrofolate reductase